MFAAVLACAVLAAPVLASNDLSTYSAVCTGALPSPACKVAVGIVPASNAWAGYSNGVNATGWADLRLHGVGVDGVSDGVMYYAMGFLEGYLTSQLMCDFVHNYETYTFQGDAALRQGVVDYLEESHTWTMQNVATNQSAYWTQVGLMFTQLEGVLAGHLASPNKSCTLGFDNMLLANVQGDIGDLIDIVDMTHRPNWFNMTLEDVKSKRQARSHCSLCVRFLPDMSDIFGGHNTWESYIFMTRIFKLYVYPNPQPGDDDDTSQYWVQFSSYPATLTSVDDFFQTSAGLWVSETTNDIFDTSLYSKCSSKSLMSWTRTVVSNALSSSGEEWTNMFGWYNSGTYNNMWVIIDYKLFTAGKPLVPKTLMIVEQIPGLVVPHDLTGILGYGYFPSYNQAYDQYIRDVSGYTAMEQKFGNDFSYMGDPRGQIFRRDALKVMNVPDMKALMQYNDFQNDPLSGGSATEQIAARYDLNAVGASPGGAVDAKITTSGMNANGTAWAISGPTHETQAPFTWTPVFSLNHPHVGQPATFNFEWTIFGQ